MGEKVKLDALIKQIKKIQRDQKTKQEMKPRVRDFYLLKQVLAKN
jgi:hypothetical protein